MSLQKRVTKVNAFFYITRQFNRTKSESIINKMKQNPQSSRRALDRTTDLNATQNASRLNEQANITRNYVKRTQAIQPTAIYRKIFNRLQQNFLKNDQEETMMVIFKNQIVQNFKIFISFDVVIVGVLRSMFREYCQSLRGSHAFINKVKFLSKMNSMLHKNRFISFRDFSKLALVLRKEEESPANAWLENLDYLKDGDDIEEFRKDFLIRYCGIEQQEAEQIVDQYSTQASLQRMKQEYTKFFQRCIKEDIDTKVVTFVQDVFSQKQNKSQMLSIDLINALDKKLGANVGSSDAQFKINNQLARIAQSNAHHNDQDNQQRLQQQVNLLQKSLQKFSGLKMFKQKKITLRVGRFGSLISGFAGIDADMDLTILTNSYVKQIQFLDFLHEFLKRDYQSQDRTGGRRVTVDIIRTANTPLISIKIGTRGKSDIKIDIIINNVLGVINSKFLAVYSQVRWIKNLGLLLKMWAKNVNMIDKSNLSSYAIVLMMIHYLIVSKKVKPILDNRATNKETPHFVFKRVKQGVEQIFKVNYCFKTDPKQVTSYQRVNYLEVMKGFMKYYSEQFWKQDESRRIVTVDQSFQKKIDPDTAITIKDPFDQPHNPGRMQAASLDFLKQKCKDAYEILNNQKLDRIKDMFEK